MFDAPEAEREREENVRDCWLRLTVVAFASESWSSLLLWCAKVKRAQAAYKPNTLTCTRELCGLPVPSFAFLPPDPL